MRRGEKRREGEESIIFPKIIENNNIVESADLKGGWRFLAILVKDARDPIRGFCVFCGNFGSVGRGFSPE